MNEVVSLQAHKSADCAQGHFCLSFDLEDSSNLRCYPVFTGYLVLEISKDRKCLHA
jgi:hypothetical protein